MVTWYALVSVIAISLVSFVGVLALTINRPFLKQSIFILVSLAAGALLGDAFIHLIPESYELWEGNTLTPSIAVIGGIILFFLIEKFIHWHHHINSEEAEKHVHVHPSGYLILMGDAVHNFLDGILLASAFLVSIPIGWATALAVFLHEIPQEIGDFGVLIKSGFTIKRALWVNFLTALTAVLGTVLVLGLKANLAALEPYILPAAAGGFIYIAASDLIPELQRENQPIRSVIQVLVLILGVIAMALLTLLE